MPSKGLDTTPIMVLAQSNPELDFYLKTSFLPLIIQRQTKTPGKVNLSELISLDQLVVYV